MANIFSARLLIVDEEEFILHLPCEEITGANIQVETVTNVADEYGVT